MNILLTSVGRRAYLVDYFREALAGNGKVYVSNSNRNVNAFLHADESIETPMISSPKYIEFLLDYCKQKRIDAIIPLFDVDIKVISQNKELFEKNNIYPIVSDYKVVDICNDKLHTSKFLNEIGILTPETFSSLEEVNEHYRDTNSYMVKPRWGMGSIGIYEAENLEEISFFYDYVRKNIFRTYLNFESKQDCDRCVLIQKKIEGKEYGLDIINDLDGNYQTTVVKMKQGMRAGETDAAIVVHDKKLESLGQQISKKLKHVGNLDVDVIMTTCKEVFVIEMNARFGGGYPFSHYAGVNLPKAIIKWLNKETVENEILSWNNSGYIYKGIVIEAED